jgi:hypothetical protein
MSNVTNWPDPRPDPATERGENLVTHLLPARRRIFAMTRAQRLDLLIRVEKWRGSAVEQFRAWVAEANESDDT